MSNAIYHVPKATNEVVLNYAPNSPEKNALRAALKNARSTVQEIPMHIGGKHVFTAEKLAITPPYDHKTVIAHASMGDASHVEAAIAAALAAKPNWENMAWQARAAIFLKAADLLSTKYRARMNAATMLGQSKNIYQSEIDAIAEFADFLRFNVQYMTEIYNQQPVSSALIWNQVEYRPLEGFVFALTPFNFTAIAGNLCAAPAMLGNVIVWKPADTQIYSAQVIMEIFEEAGLPDGVINLIYGDGPTIGNVIFHHKDFAGLHFTGSTAVFRSLWKTIGENLDKYVSYPRIVGETGGKDFIFAHPTADVPALATAMIRGAFEFQGQKCSAASRAYVPKSLWKATKTLLVNTLKEIKTGSPEDFTNFVNAVIDARAYNKITQYIEFARSQEDCEIISGGKYSNEIGYFIEPTVIATSNPKTRTMVEEIFGPVLTIFIYEDKNVEKTLDLLDTTSDYALTGAIFAKERGVIEHLQQRLRYAAGNFYINDKPTGAVVGQQPFGGGRASGTNDKAGSILNLYRWISPRTVKEALVPPTDYRYPFMQEA
ncbi:MAG: L-glutamate gamma-semialdehyde dehydrogenase [Bacteroidota bacterium]|jgi:1-pyrroline-5-carboxylate dehydrogenase